MADVRAAMRLIGGIEPTAEQIQRVQAIAHSLDIGQSDAMLPILIALDQYHSAFSGMPEACERAAHAAAISAQQRAAAASTEVVMGAIDKMAPAFAETLHDITEKVVLKDKWMWVAICMATAFFVVSITSWIAFRAGYETGYANGTYQTTGRQK